MGFLETPYRKVDNGTVNINDFTYLSAEEEEGMKIAQANIPMDENGKNYIRKGNCKGRRRFPGSRSRRNSVYRCLRLTKLHLFSAFLNSVLGA